jgi:hypothetical protein
MGLLGDDVQMVLARIEEAGNEGPQLRFPLQLRRPLIPVL